MAHALFFTPQRPLHRAFYPPCRNDYKQANDPTTELLLQEHHIDPIRHSVHLCLILRGHVCLSSALSGQSRRRMARFNSLQ